MFLDWSDRNRCSPRKVALASTAFDFVFLFHKHHRFSSGLISSFAPHFYNRGNPRPLSRRIPEEIQGTPGQEATFQIPSAREIPDADLQMRHPSLRLFLLPELFLTLQHFCFRR